MWFEGLTGFIEETPSQVRDNLEVNGNTITSSVNGKSMLFAANLKPLHWLNFDQPRWKIKCLRDKSKFARSLAM